MVLPLTGWVDDTNHNESFNKIMEFVRKLTQIRIGISSCVAP